MSEQPIIATSTQPAASSKPGLARMAGAMILLQTVASLCYPAAKYGLTIIEPFTFAFYRYIISSLVLLTVVWIRKPSPPIERQDWWRIAYLGLLIIPFNQTLFLVGQSMTGAGHGAFIFATTPVWIFLLAMIHLKEKMRARQVIGIAIAFAGVLAIMASGGIEIGSEYLIGDAIILVSVLAWAYYTILGKKLVSKYGAWRVTAYALSIGSAFYMPFGAYFAINLDYSQTNWQAWGSVVYMALGLSVLVYVLWYWLLKYFDASRIAVWHNVQPVIASAVAFLFLGETLSTVFVVGGLVVLTGVLITES